MLRRLHPLVSLAGLIVLGSSAAFAGSITLEWDPVAQAAGYRVYWGPGPGDYTESVDVGRTTRYTVHDLGDCTSWHFAVKAYNAVGESGFSNEVDNWPKPTVSNASPTVGMQGEQLTVTLSGTNFQAGLDIDIDNPAVFLSGTTVSCNEIQTVATVEPTAPGIRPAQVGLSTVTVTNPDDFVVTVPFEVLIDPARFDINHDDATTAGRIDGRDTVWLSRRFGSHEGDPLYHPDFDLDGNGWVDGLDLAYIAGNLGGCWTGSGWSLSACE